MPTKKKCFTIFILFPLIIGFLVIASFYAYLHVNSYLEMRNRRNFHIKHFIKQDVERINVGENFIDYEITKNDLRDDEKVIDILYIGSIIEKNKDSLKKYEYKKIFIGKIKLTNQNRVIYDFINNNIAEEQILELKNQINNGLNNGVEYFTHLGPCAKTYCRPDHRYFNDCLKEKLKQNKIFLIKPEIGEQLLDENKNNINEDLLKNSVIKENYYDRIPICRSIEDRKNGIVGCSCRNNE